MRRVLRSRLRHADQADEDLIRLALDDEAVLGTLYDNAMRRARRFGESTASFSITNDHDGAPVVDNLLKLLQWFVNNGPALIEIIELIVGLFGSVSEAVAACEAETIFVD